jgi:hypothetical protein
VYTVLAGGFLAEPGAAVGPLLASPSRWQHHTLSTLCTSLLCLQQALRSSYALRSKEAKAEKARCQDLGAELLTLVGRMDLSINLRCLLHRCCPPPPPSSPPIPIRWFCPTDC